MSNDLLWCQRMLAEQERVERSAEDEFKRHPNAETQREYHKATAIADVFRHTVKQSEKVHHAS